VNNVTKILLAAVGLAAASQALAADATPDIAPPDNRFATVYQLASQPLALVKNDRCKVRGAVWANGPRPFINVELVAKDGTTHLARTNAVGIYSISIPFAGTPTTFEERISDPIYLRPELADKARIYSPPIECSRQSTAASLRSINSRSKR